MQLVQVTESKIDIEDPFFGKTELMGGKIYLTHDLLANALVKHNWAKHIGDGNGLSHLSRKVLRRNDRPVRVLFLFHGGLGDAIWVNMLFDGLKKAYNFEIDVGCHYDTWEYVLSPMGFDGKWIKFPIEIERISEYDYIQTDVTNFMPEWAAEGDKAVAAELSYAYRIDLSKISVNYSIPDAVMRSMQLPEDNGIRIGLNFESKGNVKKYPDKLGIELIEFLIDCGFDVYRFGSRPSAIISDFSLKKYHDYSGRTNIFELAALARQMDLVISVDSFPIHLANVLGVRSIALLSSTVPELYQLHENVVCISSQIDCAQCRAALNKCPRNYKECVAFYHPSIKPERITAMAVQECRNLFGAKLTG